MDPTDPTDPTGGRFTPLIGQLGIALPDQLYHCLQHARSSENASEK
jgi:hypothetical protein